MNDTTSNVSPNGIGALPFTPLYAPNAIFVAVFTILLFIQVVFTIQFCRFFGYSFGMLGGLLLELLGYIAKVQLYHNRANKNAYIMFIIGLTLGPTLLSSSLYLGISALQRRSKHARFSRIGPRLFATLFILGDFICLCFIGIGGSLAAIYADSPIGVDLMIAGLGTQVLFTAIFCVVVGIMYSRLRTEVEQVQRYHIILLSIAAACLFIRSCWRVAELNDGFNGPLASRENIFIALDSIPMVIMSILLTVLHPKFWFQEAHVMVPKRPPASYQWGGRVLPAV